MPVSSGAVFKAISENGATSMSSSLLYHGWGIRGYRHVRTRFEFGAMVLMIELPPEKRCCCDCGSRDVHSRGHPPRMHVIRTALPTAPLLRRQFDDQDHRPEFKPRADQTIAANPHRMIQHTAGHAGCSCFPRLLQSQPQKRPACPFPFNLSTHSPDEP